MGSGDGFSLERHAHQTMNLGVVPEPRALVLMLSGLVGLALAGRRKRAS